MIAYNTDWYIRKISNLSNSTGDKLLQMLDEYHKHRLLDITTDEAREFYEKIKN